MTKVAVIDLSVPSLTICDIPEGLDHEAIEWLLETKGFKMSECSWGEFEGDIRFDKSQGEHVGPPEMYLGDE